MFMIKYCEHLKGNPVSLLKLSECSQILMASFSKWSMQPVVLASTVVVLKFMLCSAAADYLLGIVIQLC
jgi:hypothetical protein